MVEHLEGLSKEEFEAQVEFEEKLMEQMFSKPPIEVQMGGKREMLNYIAEMAVELYEGQDK